MLSRCINSSCEYSVKVFFRFFSVEVVFECFDVACVNVKEKKKWEKEKNAIAKFRMFMYQDEMVPLVQYKL